MPHQPSTLLISPYFDAALPSGGVLYSIDVVREWLRRGRQVHVACIDRPRTLGDLSADVATSQLVLHPIASEENGRFTHHPDAAVYTAMRTLIHRLSPELVHVHNTQGMLSAVTASLDLHTPTILTALDFGLVCLNHYLHAGTPRVCEQRWCASACAHCVGRGIRGPAGYFGKVLPRSITRRLWPRFVRLDQVKSVDEIHRLMQRITAGVDRFIAPSPGMADILVDAGVPAGHVRQLAYGLSPDKMLRPVKAISEALRFGFVGGADPVKGFSTIAAALNLLPAGLPLEIRAFGGDALRLAIDHLPARAKSYVTHTAPRFGRALMEEHARIDAMLVPSVWHENSPFAAIESFANGTPVLGADEPGISHLIVPERNGWIIEAGNAKAWARAFIEAVQQPARIRRMQAIASYARTTADFVDDVERVEASLRPAQPAFMTHRPAVARCMA